MVRVEPGAADGAGGSWDTYADAQVIHKISFAVIRREGRGSR